MVCPFSPHHDGTKMQHGFASLFDTGAGLGLIWLDGRAMKPGTSPDDEGTGDMALRGAHFDRAWKQLSEERWTSRLRVLPDGRRRVARRPDRRVSQPLGRRSARHLRVAVHRRRLDGSGVVHEDGWKIDGCPVNGPRSARTAARSPSPGSPREGRGARVRRVLAGRGRTFSAPVQVDDGGSLGRVDVEQMADGSAIVGWIELAGRNAAFKVRRIERGGRRSARSPSPTSASAGTAAIRASRGAGRN
jgi:hypothetical protein